MAEEEVKNTEQQPTEQQPENNTEQQQPENQSDKPSENTTAENSGTPPDNPPKPSKEKKKKEKKKKGKNEEPPDDVSHSADFKDIITLRRTAKEVKKYVVWVRVMSVLLIVLIALIAVGYAISYFYDKFGGFTVQVNKFDMINQGLSLSETPEYDKSIATLNADIVYDMTNISGMDLPANIDMINGAHNGEGYMAYTFYLINAGKSTLSYREEVVIESSQGGVDEAIRVAVYKDGVKTVYGKTKSNGTGKESDCDEEFRSATCVMSEVTDGFPPEALTKYTVVIWLEGNDPDCVDDIIGGTMKFSMNFKIIENT